MTEKSSSIKPFDEFFEHAIKTMNSSTTIEELFELVGSILPLKMACYHHFAAIGSFDYKSLSQYFEYKIPQPILNYFDQQPIRKSDPTVIAAFAKGQFIWLSEMQDQPVIIAANYQTLVQKTLELTGDGLCIPLYGPNNRCAYIFIAFGITKSECNFLIPFQIQALAQIFHLRYCSIIEALQKTVKLTPREAQVMELITFGKTNAEIGEILNISSNTVASYVKRLFLKLEVSDRVSAAMRIQTIKVAA